ncbi:IS6 family transposase [Sphaerothrix gracilis]|uniref:IS6 family transposase n=1 Tax=Sphaerothrix gracilis TaxID=3151835 RepID=UPI0031FD2A52
MPIKIPTNIVFQVLYRRICFKLSYRDVAELFWLRGFHFTHETVRHWSERFAAEFAEHIRNKRQQTFGRIWYVDETYVRIQGKWCYLYRGIDEYGNLLNVQLSEHRDIDEYGNLLNVRLSEHRDTEAAKAFFEQVSELMPEPPERVVTDGHSSYPRAISEVLGKSVQHEVFKSVNNPVEQSHRKLKQRYYPTMGFSNVETAGYFCEAVEELNQFLRVRQAMAEYVSLPERRSQLKARMSELRGMIKVA